MGRSRMPGIYADASGDWHVDKIYKGRRLREDFGSDYEEAEGWLLKQLEQRRQVVIHGERGRWTFEEAAAHYVASNERKTSLETEIYSLQRIMPYVGHIGLHEMSNEALKPAIAALRGLGRKAKTINLSIAMVRLIVRLAASEWQDENGKTWLPAAPVITEIDVDDQRPPQPITWPQQRLLLPRLPDHLARMALFVLNTGARDDVVCSLQWDWEVWIEELGRSVFRVPREHVKGRRRERWLILNSVAQSVIDSVRGMHPKFVFVYSARVKKPKYRPVGTMHNTAWQSARSDPDVGLEGLHVHDLRHTVGMRLREAGVREETRDDILWHSRKTMTAHYGVAQVKELVEALELVTDERHRVNKTLEMIAREQAGPRKVPAAQRKTA